MKTCMQAAEWLEGSDVAKWAEEKSQDAAATLMSRRFMSCWSAERKPWLILGKTIWAGVCEVKGCRRLEGGPGPRRRRKRRQRRRKGGRREEMQRETDFVRKWSSIPAHRTNTFLHREERSTLFIRSLGFLDQELRPDQDAAWEACIVQKSAIFDSKQLLHPSLIKSIL